MANDTAKIEIIENTLLRLLVRRGTDADRQNTILKQGELGYTTDTQRLYVGDGSTLGGNLVTGTRFLGVAGDITTLAPGVVNDLGFNSSNNKLYCISEGTGSLPGNWTQVGGIYSNDDGTITIESDNNVKLGTVGAGLTKDANNLPEIASTIATDRINPKTAAYVSLAQKTAFGDLIYEWPSNGAVNTYLRYNNGGILTWEAIGGTSTTFVNEEIMPVGTIIPYADSTAPAGGKWLRCDGSYISTVQYPDLSGVVGTTYGPLSDNGGTDYFKLPDLRGRTVIGFTNTTVFDLSSQGRTFALGVSGGIYAHQLELNEMPQHRHELNHPDNPALQFYVFNDSNSVAPEADVLSQQQGPDDDDDAQYYPYTNYAGEDAAHPNMQPYVALNYIIKAVVDNIADCQITPVNGLSAEDAFGSVFNINPLSGVYNIGLETVLPAEDVGYLAVDNKGRVTSFDTSSAGDTSTVGPQSTPVQHSFGFINFLSAPVEIASISLFGSVPLSWGRQINVYPSITAVDGAAVTPAVSLPSNAKNVILDIQCSTNYSSVYASMNGSLSGAAGHNRGTYEYVIMKQSGYLNGGQVIVPLSANTNNNTTGFWLRGQTQSPSIFAINIVGWTL